MISSTSSDSETKRKVGASKVNQADSKPIEMKGRNV